MKHIVLAAAFALAPIAASAQEHQEPICFPADMAQRQLNELHMELLAKAPAPNHPGTVLQMWANRKGDWMMLAVNPEVKGACIIDGGNDAPDPGIKV